MSELPIHARWEDAPGVLRGLLALEAALTARGDRRAVFCSAYVGMTEGLITTLGRGIYADERWVHHFTALFADHYRVAFLGWDGGVPHATTPAWRMSFEAADGRLPVLHDLVLGLVAHILDDLPLALAISLRDFGSPTAEADYLKIMAAVHASIDPIQDRVARRYAPGLFWLDRLALRSDEWTTSAMIWAHRRVALAEARSLSRASEAEFREQRAAIERRALAVGRFVLRAPPSRRLRAAFARLEQVDPRRVRGLRRVSRWAMREPEGPEFG